MGTIRWVGGLVAAAALYVTLVNLGGPARAASQVRVSASTQDNSSGSSTTMDITVEGLEGETKFKDFHFFSPSNKKFDNPSGGTTISVQPRPSGTAQSWKVSKGKDGKSMNVYADGESGFGNGEYRIVFTWPKGQGADVAGCSWEATKDGDATDDADDGIGSSGGASTMIDVPTLKIRANNGNPLQLGVGQTTLCPCQSEPYFAGYSYAIYTSTSLNEEYADPLEIGINHPSAPVPPEWGLSFSNLTGNLDASGSPTSTPSITVPNEPMLLGHTFFLVFAILENGDIIHASDPIEVTIQ